MAKNVYKVGLYIRLSREDGDNLESESIKNQRTILHSFLEGSTELCYIDEYVDDGFSGSTFERPAWKRLLLDLDQKRIDTIITKDLSRMGRDYIRMGEYIERIFPERGIRYIAINDDIDTLYETPGMEFLQFKLMFNDYFLKDTSKKIRKILRSKKEQGQFLGWKAPYGYKKDPKDHHRLIVDKEASIVVQRIFSLANAGKRPQQIAELLTKEGVATPSNYAHLNRGTENLWSLRTVRDILSNEMYVGHLIQGTRRKINYKSSREVRTPKEDWIVCLYHHPPLVDAALFQEVQLLLKKNRYHRHRGNSYLLRGLLRCKECNHAIGVHKSSDHRRYYCSCTYYLSHSKFGVCTPHSLNYLKLEEALLQNLRTIMQDTVDLKKITTLLKQIHKKQGDQADLSRNLEKIQKEQQQCQDYIDQVYDDYLKQEIDIDCFHRFKDKYQQKIESLKNQRERLERFMYHEKNDDEDRFFQKVQSYFSLNVPDRSLLLYLIDKILISEDRTIEIYYKFKM